MLNPMGKSKCVSIYCMELDGKCIPKKKCQNIVPQTQQDSYNDERFKVMMKI